jgi:GT2 family glycosyltransferase
LQVIRPNSRVIKSTVRNAGVQRNMGVKLAKGDIIIFLDDDCLVQPGWWPAIIKPLLDDCRLQTTDRRPQTQRAETLPLNNSTTQQSTTATPIGGVACIAGAVWMNPHPQFTDAPGGFVNWMGIPNQVTHRSEKAPRDVDWPISCNMACLKKAYTEIGGMADVYGVYDEDVDFGLKLRRAGWRIIFEPGAAVYHYSLSRRQRVATKSSEFRAGRNRSMLLVRNFGVSSRLLLFFVTTPFIRLWLVMSAMLRQFAKGVWHSISYMSGMLAGIAIGVKHPPGKDVKRFKDLKTEE